MPVLAENMVPGFSLDDMNETPLASEERSTKYVHERLNEIYRSSPVFTFDNDTPLVLFSDCHRGVGAITDPFTKNQQMYHHVLKYYFEAGYTYIEAGDGDEMYKYELSNILNYCGQIYQLLHEYCRRERLVMIAGNHDLGHNRRGKISKDGIIAHEGVILENGSTSGKIFIVHGHQADIIADRYRAYGKAFVRYLIDPLLKLGFISLDTTGEIGCICRRPLPKSIVNWVEYGQSIIENRLKSWVRLNRQMLICGHTHRYLTADSISIPYFNSGSCLAPGLMTGFEIVKGKIEQVKWVLRKPLNGGAGRIKRELMGRPLDLTTYCCGY